MENELICIIPCRAGSQRLEYKNKLNLHGKPLYQWTVEQAISVKEIDTIYITTDDHDIIEGCLKYEEQDIRVKVIVEPQYLANPESPPWGYVECCCQREPDDAVILLLQVTNPLRLRYDVINCINLFELYGKKMGLISLCYDPINKTIDWNGAIFMQYLGTIRTTKSFVHSGMIAYLMPPERSIDIDYKQDFELAEIELEKRLKENDEI